MFHWYTLAYTHTKKSEIINQVVVNGGGILSCMEQML